MQVRAGVLKRVNHVVRHIRAGTRFGIDPSVPPMYKRQRSPQHKVGDYVHTWAISIASALLSRRLTAHRLKNAHPIHVYRFQIIQIRVIRLLRTVRIECARNAKELLPEVREKPAW